MKDEIKKKYESIAEVLVFYGTMRRGMSSYALEIMAQTVLTQQSENKQ